MIIQTALLIAAARQSSVGCSIAARIDEMGAGHKTQSNRMQRAGLTALPPLRMPGKSLPRGADDGNGTRAAHALRHSSIDACSYASLLVTLQ